MPSWCPSSSGAAGAAWLINTFLAAADFDSEPYELAWPDLGDFVAMHNWTDPSGVYDLARHVESVIRSRQGHAQVDDRLDALERRADRLGKRLGDVNSCTHRRSRRQAVAAVILSAIALVVDGAAFVIVGGRTRSTLDVLALTCATAGLLVAATTFVGGFT
jgi:hypothetical protein